MVKKIDLRGFSDEEKCENAKEVASKVGIQIICSDEDEQVETNPTLHVPDHDGCENKKELASRFGVQVVCEDQD